MTSLNNLAVLYQMMGAYQKAIPLLKNVLDVDEKQLGMEHLDTAVSLNNLASAYQDMGVYQKAAALYRRSLVIRQKKLNIKHPDLTNSLNNLASLLSDIKEYQKAEVLFQGVLTIRKKFFGITHPLTLNSINNLAELYRKMGKYKKAELLFQDSINIFETKFGKKSHRYAISINNKGLLYYEMKKYQKAEYLYQQVLNIVAKLFNIEHPNTVTIQTNYARLLEAKKHSKAAIFFAKYALNILQTSRKKQLSLPKEFKSSFIGRNESIYRDLVTELLNQNRLQEAEHVMAMYKEKEVADYFKKDRSQKDNRPATLIGFNTEEQPWNKRYQKITNALYTNYQAYKKIKEKEDGEQSKEDQQQLKKLEKTLVKNEANFKQFLDDINKPWPKSTVTDQKKQPDALQKTLAQLGDGVVIVNYYVQKDKVRILLTTPTTRILRENAIPLATLREQINSYRTRLKQKQPLRHLSQELHKLLIDPIIADLKQMGAKTLMFSLDNILRYLPMSALHNGESYLIERYQLSIYTPAVGYQALTAETSKQPQIIALGVTEAATISEDKDEDPPTQFDPPIQFSALPNVHDEITRIVRTDDKESTGIITGKRYFNEEAKKEVLINALSKKQFQIVHLATHFSLNINAEDKDQLNGDLRKKSNGYQSFLLLGEQSILSIAELYRHADVTFEGVDLLTVSACDTGSINQQSDGSEIESFAAIAQQKGAKAVLASLWKVSDRSTSELMQRFYRFWQHGKKTSKLAALQQAQLHFIQQEKGAEKPSCSAVITPGMTKCADLVAYPQQSHPYYWAAFTLMGNGA